MKTEVYDFNKITGSTHKRIGIDEVVQDALDNGVNTISVISSGNYRDAILDEMKRKHVGGRLRLVNLVNETRDMPEIELGTRGIILRTAQEREKYVSENMPNVGKTKDYTDFVSRALEQEAENMLQSSPDYVALGLGSGKLFVTLYRKIKERGLKTKLVGILPKGENVIFNEGNFKFRSLADKLTAPYSSFKGEVLQAKAEGHILYEATEREFKRANRIARRQGFDSEISGSAGFVINDEQVMTKCKVRDDSRVVIVNTGCGEQAAIVEPLYFRALKPILAAAASVLICFGANQAIKEYRISELNRSALTSVADMAAKMIGENPNFTKMSYSELNDYIVGCKGKIGGPHPYFL